MMLFMTAGGEGSGHLREAGNDGAAFAAVAEESRGGALHGGSAAAAHGGLVTGEIPASTCIVSDHTLLV